jgi:hypothetical protein
MSYVIGEYIRRFPYIYEEANIQSDEYNNAILIKKCIERLDKNGSLTDFEKMILQGIADGYNYAELSRILNADKQTISDTFEKITDRIAYILGGEFTDASFVNRIPNFSNIPPEHVKMLIRHGFMEE